MNSRTILDFEVAAADPAWEMIRKWAGENGYNQKMEEGNLKRFQKGTGFLVAPMMLEISINGNSLHLEAWVRANLFIRICALFLVPAEMHIKSGGFRLAAPRKIARKAVNKLLEMLGQEVIP